MTPSGLIDDRFRIERLAGSGGMGVVFRALDLRDERPVAIKVLLRDADSIQLRRFLREAERLGDLAHPSIVRYVAHGTTARGEPYLAMEWLEGETLTDRLARAPLTVDEVVAMSRAIAAALGTAHRQGLVHRDVKPANVFLSEFDPRRPKLLDFGIARTHRETLASSAIPPNRAHSRDLGVWNASLVLAQLVGAPAAGLVLDLVHAMRPHEPALGYATLFVFASACFVAASLALRSVDSNRE